MEKLTELPNIGTTLANKLKQAGIHTPAELKKAGSPNAFSRIYTIDPDACYNMIYALEGAIQNIRWHKLSKDRKKELKITVDQLKTQL